MSNIFVDLELPVNARIDFGFKPRKTRDKAEKYQDKVDAVREVSRALNEWWYTTQSTEG